jgi:hypothetical protein
MYSKGSAIRTSDGAEPINLIFVPLQDSSTSILSPLGLGIIGIAMATTLIISVIITKKIK